MSAFAKKLAARMKKKKERRVYLPRVLGSGQVMMPADLKRLHKYMLEIDHISVISDEVRTVVEEEWPEQTTAEKTAGIRRMSAFGAVADMGRCNLPIIPTLLTRS